MSADTNKSVKKLLKQHENEVEAFLRSELRREDLIEFSKYIDPTVADKYSAPHLRYIGDALEQVERGERPRLFITTPPRHWKSSLVSEKFPSWYLGRNPSASVGIFSHGQRLPTRFSINVRKNLSFNQRFKDIFPKVNVTGGNTQDWSVDGAFRSSCRSMGVGSAPTGEGFDLIIIDDPVGDANEANSPNALEKCQTWYRETLRDRLNPHGAIVLVMSRWAQKDLAGHVMKESRSGDGEHWDELRLPAIAEEGCPLGRKPGDALWPEWVNLEMLAALKKAQGARAFAARFQGTPRADDGGLLVSSKLVMVDAEDLPAMPYLMRHWDLAFTDNRNSDYACGLKMGVDNAGNRYILSLKRVRGTWPKLKQLIVDTALHEGPEVTCSIECNGPQLGYWQDVYADNRMIGRRVIQQIPKGPKEMRAAIWGSRLEDGIIKCVRSPWNGELFDEMDYFPNAEHDDVVDSVSGAWQQLDTGIRNLSDSMMPAPPRKESPVGYDRVNF